MKTEVEFYPAVMVGHFNKITSNNDNPIYKFWGEGSYFQYDKLLYSFYYLQDRYKKLSDGQSYFDHIGYTGKRMIDSGGFQLKTKDVKIDPIDVLNCYNRESADVGYILDYPMSNEYNQTLIDKTYANVKVMVENKHLSPNTELLNVAHGSKISFRKKYYEQMKEFNEHLDGWAVGLIKRLPPIFVAWSFMYLYENDKTLKDKRFHFLGLTGNVTMPVIYYLAKLNLVKSISFDSTKYGIEGIMYDMRNPSFNMERMRIGNMSTGKMDNNDWCNCPVCQNNTLDDMRGDCNLVILHNMYWECKKMDFFNSFSDAESIKSYLIESTQTDKRTMDAIKFIDCALEQGVGVAEEKFAALLNASYAESTKSTLSQWF